MRVWQHTILGPPLERATRLHKVWGLAPNMPCIVEKYKQGTKELRKESGTAKSVPLTLAQ